jgi:streptomycin 6-kinase
LIDAALRDLTERWRRYWPGSAIEAIEADVRERFGAACEAWSLGQPQPLTGGVVALTCATSDRVLKVLPRFHPEAEDMLSEARTLRAWRGCDASVELLDERDAGMTLLLERIRPGTTLDDAVVDYDEQLAIVGSLVQELHAASEPPLAHGDLHGGNVLRGADRWVAIDPKGPGGDRYADVWLLVCPQAPPLPETANDASAEALRRVAVYARAAGLDPGSAARSAAAIAAREARLSADSAFEAWPQRLERLTEALSR